MKTIKLNENEFEVMEMNEITAGDFDEVISEITDESGRESKKITPWLKILVKKWTKDGKQKPINTETIKEIKISEAIEIIKEIGLLKEGEINSLESLFKKKIDGQKQK